MECIDKEVNIRNILFLEMFDQIFAYLNHYELAAVRLVCKHFNHASSYEFGRKSRLVVNPINLPELDNFVQKSSPHFQIRHVRILNLKVDKSYDPFNCTNLANLPTTINDLEVVECPGIDEKILLQICARFTNMTTLSFINETNDTKIDAAYLIGHLCGRLKSLTLKIRNVTEHLEVPVITTSLTESLTILHRQHDVHEFEKSTLFAVIAAISKGLNHLSLDFWHNTSSAYNDDAVVLLSELEWNLESLELLIEPKSHSSDALTVWFKKIEHRLTELTLHGHFLDIPKFSIFEWVCDNCPQLTKFMFVCTDNECCKSCEQYEFNDKRLEKLTKLTKLKVFKVPSLLANGVNDLASIAAIQQLNSHLRHLEIAFEPYSDPYEGELRMGCISHFKDLTNLKITRLYAHDDLRIQEIICEFFEHFTNLQVLSIDMLRDWEEDEYKQPLFDEYDDEGDCDVRNLKQLRRIEIRYGHKWMGGWVAFELLARMPGLQSITFRDYKDKIKLRHITRILRNCTRLTKLHFTDCKWGKKNEVIKSQLIATLPYGRKCSIKVD